MFFSFVDFILENPNIMLSIGVFLICVLIGFFGDKRFKKNGTLDKFTKKQEVNEEQKMEPNEEQTEEKIESKIEDAINNIGVSGNNVVSNDSKDDLDFTQSFKQDEQIVNPYENNSLNPLVEENSSYNSDINSNNVSVYNDLVLSNDDEINNMF